MEAEAEILAERMPQSPPKTAVCMIVTTGVLIPTVLDAMEIRGFEFQACINVTPAAGGRNLPMANMGMRTMARTVLVGAHGARPDMSGHDAMLDCGDEPLEKALVRMAQRRFPATAPIVLK